MPAIKSSLRGRRPDKRPLHYPAGVSYAYFPVAVVRTGRFWEVKGGAYTKNEVVIPNGRILSPSARTTVMPVTLIQSVFELFTFIYDDDVDMI